MTVNFNFQKVNSKTIAHYYQSPIKNFVQNCDGRDTFVKYNKDWKKAVKISIINMLTPNKISEYTANEIEDSLDIKHTRLNPEVLSDIKLLKQGKSVVPEFAKGTSVKEAFKKTKVGDVVQIGEKMYINDGKILYPWKMTREKYDKLFPPVERYMIKQGNLPNCFFVSALRKCMSNPYSRAEIYKSFEVDGEDIYCTIRAYRDFFGTKKYTNGLYLYDDKHLESCKGLQILEQTYAQCLLSKTKKFIPPQGKKPNIKTIMSRFNDGGSEATVMNELLGVTLAGTDDINFNKSVINSIRDIPKSINRFSATMISEYSKEEIIKLIKRLANDNRYLLNVSTVLSKDKGLLNKNYYIVHCHSYSINGYDKKKDILIVENPHEPFISYEIPLSVFQKHIDSLSITKLGYVPKDDKNSIANLQDNL